MQLYIQPSKMRGGGRGSLLSHSGQMGQLKYFPYFLIWSFIVWNQAIGYEKTLLNVKIQSKTFCVLQKRRFDDFFASTSTDNDHFPRGF